MIIEEIKKKSRKEINEIEVGSKKEDRRKQQ